MLRILLVLLLMTTPAWATLAWRNGTGAESLLGDSQAADIDTNTFNNIVSPLDSLLANYRKGMALIYDSASQITVSSGEITVSDSTGAIRLMLKNANNTTVTWSDIDTGAEASATTYYLYAIAASGSATSATFKISASSTSPSGSTYYKKIGSFYNNASSNIDANKIYTEPYGSAMTDASGIVTGSIAGVLDYGTSTSSYTKRSPGIYYIVHANVPDDSTMTNFPFTSSSSYSCTATMESGTISQNVRFSSKTATGIVLGDGLGNGNTINLICVGY